MRKTTDRVDQLLEWYGDGSAGTVPTRDQWRVLEESREDTAVALINFFRFSHSALYADKGQSSGTGREAFDRYAAVSVPALAKVGGSFLLVSPVEAVVIGDSEEWDLAVIGRFPNGAAVLALFEDPDYRASYVHRAAACERQRVFLCQGF
jgi:uncharacterized protein (DUF1330 family)